MACCQARGLNDVPPIALNMQIANVRPLHTPNVHRTHAKLSILYIFRKGKNCCLGLFNMFSHTHTPTRAEKSVNLASKLYTSFCYRSLAIHSFTAIFFLCADKLLCCFIFKVLCWWARIKNAICNLKLDLSSAILHVNYISSFVRLYNIAYTTCISISVSAEINSE